MLLISPHSTCVRESIYDIASIVSPKAKEKGIDLKVNISRNTPFRLMIDDHRLRQVVMNFMSNAVKFTDKGTVLLSVTTHVVSGSNAVMEFSVQDSGIGIDEQQQKKIFEPFAQEDDSTTRQFGGTGLGLAISTQLVELMGGQIQLESEKGKGSRFFFQLNPSVVQLDFDATRFRTGVRLTAHNGEQLPVYVIEQASPGRTVIMQPWTPTPFAGAIRVVPSDKLTPLNCSLDEFSLALTHFGLGMGEAMQQKGTASQE